MMFQIDKPSCWGYEENCNYERSYSSEQGLPVCDTKSPTAREMFWKQADWGYVQGRESLFPICTSTDEVLIVPSEKYPLLERQFTRLQQISPALLREEHILRLSTFRSEGVSEVTAEEVLELSLFRYRNDLIQEGGVGGNCQAGFNGNILKGNLQQKSYLQSW